MPAKPASVLIAAQSGRALAVAARRAGFAPLVADLFGDDDLTELASTETMPGGIARGLRHRPLCAALDRLADGRKPIGLVYGSGFEDRPALLEGLARRHDLLGNSPQAIRWLKEPVAFADLCARLGIPHPEILFTPAPGAWLSKRAGATGGWHVRPARPGRPPGRACYLQRAVPGRPVSLLFLAASGRSVVVGDSEQWADPAPGRPFRYGGAARPARVARWIADRLADAVGRLAAETRLVGLNSADFLLRDDGSFDLLEINPRPGATLDLYMDDGAASAAALFRLHVEACRGSLPEVPPSFSGAFAAAIVYASRPVRVSRSRAWPDWAADRSARGSLIPGDAPFCTVFASGSTVDEAKQQVRRRAISVIARMAEGQEAGHE